MATKPSTISSLIPMIDAHGIQDWETVSGNREAIHDIKYIVVHTTWLNPIGSDTSGGTAQSNINFWKGLTSETSQSSAHYIIDSGTIYQTVDDNSIAYHAGQFSYNQKSIGIEIRAGPGNLHRALSGISA